MMTVGPPVEGRRVVGMREASPWAERRSHCNLQSVHASVNLRGSLIRAERKEGSSLLGADVKGQVQKPVGETPLVVVPRNQLDEGVVESNAGLDVEDAGTLVVHKVLGDELVLSPAEDALELALGGSLDGVDNLLVSGGLGELASQVDDTDVGSGDTEGHTSELAVELRNDLADGLGGAGGGGDDVGASAATSPPVLAAARGAVDGQLVCSGGVYGGHQTLDDAELVVHNLGQGSQAVGGAAGVRDDALALVVRGVVDTVDEDGSGVAGRSGDDDQLRAALEVLLRLLAAGEAASALGNDVDVLLAPRNLGRLALEEELNGAGPDLEGVGGHADLLAESAVDGVVLEQVLHVVGGHEGVVDGNHLEVLVGEGRAEHETTNAAEAVDTDLDNHRD
ncbi:glyceraldehyde 3-phosphate dehydrogenase [Babesia caballi]|uniref:Glyceraldehyde 3-phosphate dehydrogenase n=1 Tax=Babesia caballi TaxID=5871 RepID=A0AAV4LWP1_BABCB|nr:glyceraldehyde 3-phosphate dehydrogenase [Babesia caballi]